jgi:hypothetical protein
MPMPRFPSTGPPRPGRLLLVAAAAALGGCGSAKYTAEESGYLSLFEAALEGSCRVGGTKLVVVGTIPSGSLCHSTPFETPSACRSPTPIYKAIPINNLADLNIDQAETSERIEMTLAPQALAAAHRQLSAGLRLELSRSAGDRGRAQAAMQAACAAFQDFRSAARSRPMDFSVTDSFYLSFKPRAGPSLTYDTKEGLDFAVETSVSIPTGYGDFVAGYQAARGIHLLRVVHRGKQRLFLLDRPFEFLIPHHYSTRVSYGGGDELVMYVSGPFR